MEKIKERAEKIARENSIILLSREKEILEKLQEIANYSGNDIELIEKTLDDIERYLSVKEKMNFAERDYNYLQKLSQLLKKQETRMSDSGNPILFKTVNGMGEDMFFLTRKSLNNYLEINKNEGKKTVEILSGNSEELVILLEVIKRNF